MFAQGGCEPMEERNGENFTNLVELMNRRFFIFHPRYQSGYAFGFVFFNLLFNVHPSQKPFHENLFQSFPKLHASMFVLKICKVALLRIRSKDSFLLALSSFHK